MKILFLSSPGKDLGNPSVGVAYITAMLNKNNHEAIIYDGDNKTTEDILNTVTRVKPDIVGISMLTNARFACLNVARRIKKQFNLPIIVGGPHATLMSKQLMENYPFLDYLVRGEGEYICLDLLNALEKEGDLNKIKGLSYRKEGKIIHNPSAKLIEDLDALPFPEYKFFDLASYSKQPHYPKELLNYPVGCVTSSRGCPYNCTFCSSSNLWGRKIRFRNPKKVVDEIEELYIKYNIRYIVFMDDHFTANRQRAIDICKLIIKRKLKIKWECHSEVNVINKEILDWMKKAGCYLIAYGVEDTSEEGLRFFKKAHNLEQLYNAFKLTKEAGIKTLSYFIIGGDHETKENIELKKKAIKKLDPDITTASILVAFPGTELFERGKKNGWWNDDIFLTPCVGKKFYSGVPIYPPKNITLEQMFEEVAGFDYWWNKKKGGFSLRSKFPLILSLLKNRDFAKIFSMSKAVIKLNKNNLNHYLNNCFRTLSNIIMFIGALFLLRKR